MSNTSSLLLSSPTFPDLCLNGILDRLPLHDLLTTVPRVCTRWRTAHPSACRRRLKRSRGRLILCESRADYPVRHGRPMIIDLHRTYPTAPSLKPLYMDLRADIITKEDEEYECNRMLTPHLFNTCGLVWRPSSRVHCARLMEHLPGLTHLKCICLDWNARKKGAGAEPLARITDLLVRQDSGWWHTLTSLEIHFQMASQSDKRQEDETAAFSRLFCAINSLPHLRALSLQLYTSTLLGDESNEEEADEEEGEAPDEDEEWEEEEELAVVDLPILARLERFSFHNLFQPNSWPAPLDSLRRYVHGNSTTLRSISLKHPIDLSGILSLDPALYHRFKELCIVTPICAGSFQMPLFRDRFCAQFTSLTWLELHRDIAAQDALQTLVELMRGLVRLPRLRWLKMDISLHWHDTEEQRQHALEQLQQYPLPSVRALTLRIRYFTFHSLLERLRFVPLFPCLQVASIAYNSAACTDCNITRKELTEMVDQVKAREMVQACARHLRAPFRVCSQLRRLYFYDESYGLEPIPPYLQSRDEPLEVFALDELLNESSQ